MREFEIESVKKLQAANFRSGPVAQLLEHRTLHKDGRFVPVATMISHCHDTIISVVVRMGNNHKKYLAWKSSAEDVVRVRPERGPGALEFDKWNNRRRMVMETLSQPFEWSPEVPEQEPRVCLLLNRFTHQSTVQFMTSMGQQVLRTAPIEAIDRPFLDFIAADDRDKVRDAIATVKASDTVARVRFRWLPLGESDGTGIACDAALVGGCDALLCIFRQQVATPAIRVVP